MDDQLVFEILDRVRPAFDAVDSIDDRLRHLRLVVGLTVHECGTGLDGQVQRRSRAFAGIVAADACEQLESHADLGSDGGEQDVRLDGEPLVAHDTRRGWGFELQTTLGFRDGKCCVPATTDEVE
nr:hypothetical protein CFP56_71682 [Quercus suber]